MIALLLPILLPLTAGALAMLARKSASLQRVLAGLAIHATLLVGIMLAVGTRDGIVRTVGLGGWEGTFGITLASDALAGMMLVLAGVTLAVTFWFLVLGTEPRDEGRVFYPALLILAAGVNWSFLTADLFNLFVSFELILLSSYVLLTTGNEGTQLRESFKFVALNLLAGTLFLAGAGLVHGAYGTLNFADLATKIRAAENSHLAIALGSLFLVVFGIKAALFPVFFWLPDSYPKAPTGILPYFAGILTKVGVYCLFRFFSLLYTDSMEGWFQNALLFIAGGTMLIGVFGALSQWSFRRILSFHIISQIGYMIFGLALFTSGGFAGGLFYMAHHIVVKASLFLIAGCVIVRFGTDSLKEIRGLISKTPGLAILFILAAFSLAGIPPLSGFYGKYLLVVEGFSEKHYTLTIVSILTSVFTLASMLKIWTNSFWGEESEPVKTANATRAPIWATVGLVGVSVGIAVFSGPMMEFAEFTSAQLLDPSAYVAALSGPDAVPLLEVSLHSQEVAP
ncbi:Na+/H+ antiporter subunit D [bacterium]|nr:Na+/H+ antiporter subunit D [bacterium]